MIRKCRLIGIGLLLLCVFITSLPARQRKKESTDVVIGKYVTIPSKVLGHDRTILVSLPNEYHATARRYPVIYLLDGHIIPRFSELAAVASIQSAEGKMPELIVIGIDTQRNYAKNTFPVSVEGWPESGGADQFIEFITAELIPYVQQHYRTSDYRILFGQSNTGLLAIYTMLVAPDSFNAYISASPALGWCGDFILKKLRTYKEKHPSLPRDLFIIYGEDDYSELVLDAVVPFLSELQRRGVRGLTWDSLLIRKAGHVPLESAQRGLAYLFRDWEFPRSSYEQSGLTAILEHYQKLSSRYGFEAQIPEMLLADIGYQHLEREDWQTAKTVFELWTKTYPESARAHYFMAMAYDKLGEWDLASRHCKRALDLNANFSQASVLLEELQRQTED